MLILVVARLALAMSTPIPRPAPVTNQPSCQRAGSLLWLASGLGWNTDGQGAWLDFGEQGGGLADDVAVELVVVLPVDDDPHSFSLVLVDLVILLGASGDEP